MATAQEYAKASLNALPQSACILIVDDETLICDLLFRRLSAIGYLCQTCSNGAEALAQLREGSYDLLLADILMPGMEGTALLMEALKIRPDLAVIFVTGVADISVAVDSIKHGAYDYITKPFRLEEVIISVNRALERRRLRIQNQVYQHTLEDQVAHRTRQLMEALGTLQHTYDSTLHALSTALDSREADSEGHSARIMRYAARIADQMGLGEAEVRPIKQAALLHDVGKIGVPDELLRKPGKLTDGEWVIMRRHAEIGYRILSGINFLREAAEMVLRHQEKYDGSGYPGGLRGEEIVLGARILAVADTLECMTSDRAFQAAMSFEAAREGITRLAGSQLDPWIVRAFLQIPLPEFMSIRDNVRAHRNLDVSGLIGKPALAH
jgi:putative nucleotidyltransferase with HDIG domain